MSPSIEPATAVAIVSFITNRATTRQTVEAGMADTIRALDAARDDRLWDKQTIACEETVTYLLYLQVKRRHDIRSYRLDDDGEQQQMEWLNESYKPGPWFELQDAWSRTPQMRWSTPTSRHTSPTARFTASGSSGRSWPTR